MVRALIIDTDPSTKNDIQSTLEPYGFEWLEAVEATSAIEIAGAHSPSLILLSADLQSTSGFLVCNKLRREATTQNIPLIMYASNVADDIFEQHRSLDTHADDYIKVPFKATRLVNSIRALIDLPEAGATSPAQQSSAPTGGAMHQDQGSNETHPSESNTELEVDLDIEDSMVAPTPQEPAPEPDLGAETDAAFDALTVDTSAEPAQQETAPAQQDAAPPQDAAAAEDASQRETAPQPLPTVAEQPVTEQDPQNQASSEKSLSERLDEKLEAHRSTTSGAVETAAPAEPANASAARSDLASSPRREVLQLKTQLVAKDREMLGLTEQLATKERAILDAEQKNRQLQAKMGELEAALLQMEERAITGEERAEVAEQNRETQLKREEGIKARLEGAESKAKELETALAQAEQYHRAQAEQLQSQLQELSTRNEGLGSTAQELSAKLEAAETAADSKSQQMRHAQQAIAVALRILESAPQPTPGPAVEEQATENPHQNPEQPGAN